MNRKLAFAVVVLAVLLAGATAWLAARMSTSTLAPSPAGQAATPNSEGDGQEGLTAAAPAPSAAGDEESGGATNSFIVCPGNPRCPKGE